MQTKISLKDIEVWGQGMHQLSEHYWDYCWTCRYSQDIPNNSSGLTNRCNDCCPRVAPPTRFRKKLLPQKGRMMKEVSDE